MYVIVQGSSTQWKSSNVFFHLAVKQNRNVQKYDLNCAVVYDIKYMFMYKGTPDYNIYGILYVFDVVFQLTWKSSF